MNDNNNNNNNNNDNENNDNDNNSNNKKNGQLLPTGPWYAPSAVINDALIMSEYARACQRMPEYTRECKSMREYARVCKVVPKSSPDGSESESPMLLLRTSVI